MGTNSGATASVNNKAPVGNGVTTNCVTGTGLAGAGSLSGGCMVGGSNLGVSNINLGGAIAGNHNMAGGGLGGLGGGANNNNNMSSMAGVLGGGGGGGGGIGGNNGSSNEENNGNGGGLINNQQVTPQYTIPGILHFIQHEWSRFELERSQWDVDRAELQARIAILLGERKCLESLKSDLTRRIKMLEYALRQERAKFYRLKYGTDPPQLNDLKPSNEENNTSFGGGDLAPDSEVPYSSVSNTTWRQGRQMLRQYLAEIGYTDNIIDVRSNRVRSILGFNNNNNNSSNNLEQDENNISVNVNGGGSGSGSGSGSGENNKRELESDGRHGSFKKMQQQLNNALIMDTEASVMANFEFLGPSEMSDDDEICDDLDMVVGGGDNDEMDIKPSKRNKMSRDILNEGGYSSSSTPSSTTATSSSPSSSNIVTNIEQTNNVVNVANTTTNVANARRNLMAATVVAGVGVDEDSDTSLGLGDLAQLTVNNDSETGYDATTKDSSSSGSGGGGGSGYRKTWNAKYALRSHFDGVRALCFHPEEPVLITASEDHTLKLWNLQKTVQAKKSASLDVEPLYTFRAHTGAVLCLSMSTTGETCFSGGLDGNIECWHLPSPNIDPYDCYDPSVHSGTLEAHTDAVWGLTTMHNNIVSCSADGTVKLWSPFSKEPLLRTFTAPDIQGLNVANNNNTSINTNTILNTNTNTNTNTNATNTNSSSSSGNSGSSSSCSNLVVPSSVDFVRNELDHIVVAYSSAHCIIYDTETGKQVIKLDATGGGGGGGGLSASADIIGGGVGVGNMTGKFINKVVSHPTLPITITAHEDRHIRFWDNNSGQLVHSMVAHLEPVTSLAVDAHGLYLLSGSHDCSIRLWNLDNKTCVQEITAHRKKFDESIFDVTFHPTKPYIASAGADGLAKVFV